MKQKIWWGISLCFAIVGVALCIYCMLSENESTGYLALALLCISIGNLISIRVRKKQKETS